MKKRSFNYPYFANILASRVSVCCHILVCCMILAAAASCSDDDEIDNVEVDDPDDVVLIEPCPTTDELEVTHENRLYYLSSWTEGVLSVTENMVNRYREALPYASGVAMETGDAFLFSNQDIDRIQSDPALFAEMKSMVNEKGIIMMMEGGTDEDFNTVCTMFGVFNPYGVDGDASNTSSEAVRPLWIFSGELPGAKGFFAKLTSIDSDTDYEYEDSDSDGSEAVLLTNSEAAQPDEHGNGIKCDMASLSLQDALQPKMPQNGSASLTDMANAYIVTYQPTITLQKKFTGDKVEGTNHMQIEAKIWNVYSYGQNKQFYLVNLSSTCSAQHTFWGEWKYSGCKAYGWCLTNLQMYFNPRDNYGVTVHDYSPTTTQHQTSYTSGVSYNLGGQVSVNGPQISGGVTISNSRTVTINDIEIKDRYEPIAGKPEIHWEFVLKEPGAHFNLLADGWSKIDPGASAGITTCSVSADFIFSVPNDKDNVIFDMGIRPWFRTYSFDAGDRIAYYGKGGTSNKCFNLPKVKPE